MKLFFNDSDSLANVRTTLRRALSPKYGEREASAMARSILMNLKGWNLTTLIANEDRPASEFIRERASEIFDQLMNDVPLQYALGETTFYGLKISVKPGVLIPRPETEELVDLIVKENPGSDLSVLDLCTGSGAIALALARNLPFSKVEAVDISPRAIAIASDNASALKTRINILQADVFTLSLPDAAFDIIVSNPPYIAESEKKDMERNVLDYEPHQALFVSDEDPLVFYRRISRLARTSLKSGGHLYFEINPIYASSLREMLEDYGFTDIRIIKDVHGKDRFAVAKNAS